MSIIMYMYYYGKPDLYAVTLNRVRNINGEVTVFYVPPKCCAEA